MAKLEAVVTATIITIIAAAVVASWLGGRAIRRYKSIISSLTFHKTERFKLEELCSELEAKLRNLSKEKRLLNERRLELETENNELAAKNGELKVKHGELEAKRRARDEV